MDDKDAPKKPLNKTEILACLSEATGLTKQQVGGLFDELAKLIGRNLGEDGPGVFAIPGLLQIRVTRKPATPERKGINPFTKEETVFKAKPAKNVVKLVPLKGLKDMVEASPPNATTISAGDRQTDLDANTNMVSEGGPAS